MENKDQIQYIIDCLEERQCDLREISKNLDTLKCRVVEIAAEIHGYLRKLEYNLKKN
jgi:hypothetical protein